MNKLAIKQNYLVQANAKPILKWAGGKSQLLPVFANYYPKLLGKSIRKYIEPFFGGGAVFFDLYNSNLIDEAIILDSNPELIILYNTLKYSPDGLAEELYNVESDYLQLNEIDRKSKFYDVRENFNSSRHQDNCNSDVIRAAQIIFLNRTCFNGLFRVNSKREYNVPSGNYKNPRILDEENIYAVSKALQMTEIKCGDFGDISSLSKSDTFIYYDPPYKPLNKTSSFTAYSGEFDDIHQIRLANMYKALSEKNIFQMLSNSDPMSENGDNFFDKLYQEFNINRVEARRMINADASKRGKIFEILVTNYD